MTLTDQQKNRIIRRIYLSLSVLLLVLAGLRHAAKADEPAKVIDITAKRFEFIPAEITLKKGEAVTLRLTSHDVTHGFFVRPLKIDSDIEAGKTTEVRVTPETTGKFVTICDHFCGVNHGAMHMTINVVE